MFESVLAGLLDKYASEFLEGIDSKSAQLSIWKGDVSLRSLKVKTTAFDALKLPVTVRYGFLEELTLRIPWKDLKTKPVNVTLKGLYVVLAPVQQDSLLSSSPEQLKDALRSKARAAVDNLIKSEIAQKIPGFTERLIARIIDNIQIEFERIHISYVDTTVASGKLSFGITLQGFSAKSVDANGHESFVHESRILRKRVDLRCFSVYVNPVYNILQKLNLNQPFISSKAAQDAANSYLQQLIATSSHDTSPLAKHILLPLSTVTIIEINKSDEPDAKIPKYNIALNIPRVELHLSNDQLSGLSEVSALLSQRSRIQFYRSYRVPFRLVMKETDWLSREKMSPPTAAQRWRFACDATVAELHALNRINRFSAKRISAIMQNVKRYKQLCCIPVKLIKPNEIQEMQRIDVLIPIDLLRIVRAKHVPELIARNSALSDHASSTSSSNIDKKKKTWISGWFSKKETSSPKVLDIAVAGEASFGLGLSATEEQQLLETIDTSDVELGAQGSPVHNIAEWIKMKFTLSVGELSILLMESRPGNSGSVLGQLTLSNVNATYRVRPLGWGLDANMKDIFLSDLVTYSDGKTSFPHIIKRAPSVKDDDAIITLSIESGPPDGSCSMAITARAQPLTIVYHHEYIAALQAVFTISRPLNLLDPVTDRLHSAPISSSANMHRARTIVASATVLDIDLAAPIILIPQNGFLTRPSSSALLVLSLGRLLLSTTPVSALHREELANNPHAVESSCISAESAFSALESNPDYLTDKRVSNSIASVYDRMLLKVSGLKSLMCSVVDRWWDSAAVTAGGWDFILPIDLDIAVFKLVCASPLAVPVRVAISIHSIQMNLSRSNYIAIFKIIEVFKNKDAQPNERRDEIESAFDSQSSDEVVHIPSPSTTEAPSADENVSVKQNIAALAVTFSCKKLALAMFTSDGTFSFSNCVPRLALTDVTIEGLHAVYCRMPSGSSTVTAMLNSFIITDVRISRAVAPCFQQLLRLTPQKSENPALSLIYDTNFINQTTTTNVSLHDLEIFLISEPLALVTAIFVAAQAEQSSDKSSKPKPSVQNRPASNVKSASPWSSEMNIFVINPSVTLVSNPTDSSSPRLNLNLSLMFHVDSSGGNSSTRMCVQELNILRSVQGKERSDWDKLLEPASITIEIAAAPILKNMTILVKSLAFKVSYADIRMLYTTYLTASKTFSAAMAVADPPAPIEPQISSIEADGEIDASLSQWPAFKTQNDSGSEGYCDAVADITHEFSNDDIEIPSKIRTQPSHSSPQVFRVSVQVDKIFFSLLNTLGLWSNPILELHFTDTMVDYLVGTDSHSSMGLNSSIMLTQWNPIAKTLEPLLESWTFRFEASRSFAFMLIQSRDILNVNLSASQLKGTISTLKLIQTDWADLVSVDSTHSVGIHEYSSLSSHEISKNKLLETSSKQLRTSPHTIVNATGTRLHLWFQLPYRGDTLTTSPFIIENEGEHCIDSVSLCPFYDCFVAPEIDGQPLCPHPCRLTLAGVSALVFGSGQEACPSAIAYTEICAGATVTTVSMGYSVRNNTALELYISANDEGTFELLSPGKNWYPPMISWKHHLETPEGSRKFFLKCGIKQSPAAVLYCFSGDASPSAAVLDSACYVPSRVVELPCNFNLISKSENSFFHGGDLKQNGVGIDCFVQVHTSVISSHSINQGRFVSCSIEPAFSFRNLTPSSISAKFNGSASSVSLMLLPGCLFQMCSFIRSKSNISVDLRCVDVGQRFHDQPSNIVFDVLGQNSLHPIDIAVYSGSIAVSKTRLVIERLDGSEHIIYAPYWIVNRTGVPISVCSDGRHHEACIDESLPPNADLCSALNCHLSELLEKRSAKVVMWGFSSADDGRGGRLQLQVSGAKWSDRSFAADQLGEIGCLDLPISSSTKCSIISVAIYSHVSAGAFWRTRTITLLPRHVLFNSTDEDIEVLCKTHEDSRFCVNGIDDSLYPSAIVPSKQWVILTGAPGKDASLRSFKIRPVRLGLSCFHFSPSFNIENLDGYRLRCRSSSGKPHDEANGHVFVDLGNPKIFPPSVNYKVDIKGNFGLLAAIVSTSGWQMYRVTNKSFFHIMFHQRSVPITLADVVIPGSSCDFALDDTDQKGESVEIAVLAGPNQKELHVFKINFFQFDKKAMKDMHYGDLKVTPSIQDGIYLLVIESILNNGSGAASQFRNIGSSLTRSFLPLTTFQPSKGTDKFLAQASTSPSSPSVCSDIKEVGSEVNVDVFSAINVDESNVASDSAAAGENESSKAVSGTEDAICDKRIDVKIAGIGISIIDDTPLEILYLSILGIKYTRYASMGLDMHEIYLRRVQIDADSIIVVGHSIVPPEQMARHDPLAILQLANDPIEPSTFTDADAASVWFARLIRRSDVTAMDLVSEISVSIPSLDLSLQEKSAMNVLKVVMDVAGSFSSGSSGGENGYTENQLRSWLPLETPYMDLAPLCSASQNVQRVFVESLSINPVAVRISVHLDNKPLALKGVKGGLMALPLIILNMLKNMAGNIDRAPISLNRLVFKNLLTTRERLFGRLTKHYTIQAARESYKLIGSFELLGNPVGLISNVTEGLQEFVFAPIRGAKNSPQAFAVGLVKGTGALVKGSIYGAFSSVVSLSAAVGKGVALLSLDQQYQQDRLDSAARHQNDHLGAALAHGFTAVGRGVVSGVTELFMAPVRGAQEEGFTGLLKGIGKGVLGVVFKPAAGLIELASSTASGFRNMSHLLSAASGCHRIRPSRPFFNGVMQSYSLQWAYGVALLSAATDIRSHLGEQLFDFCQLSDRLLFVTNQRIIQVKTGANKVPGRWGSIQFELPVDSIIAVFTEGDKLLVELDGTSNVVAVGSCMKFFGKKQGNKLVRTFDLRSPDRRKFSTILMSAIMSLRANSSSFSQSEWRPVSLGAIIGVSENSFRASLGSGISSSRPQAAIVGPQPWVPDDERSSCILCNRKFHAFYRKHHCRMCGIIVCSKCSLGRLSLPDLGYPKLVRVCSPCFSRRNVQNPFDAVDGKYFEGAEKPTSAGNGCTAEEVSGESRPAQESPPSSFYSRSSFGPATPPPALSASAVIAAAQQRARCEVDRPTQ